MSKQSRFPERAPRQVWTACPRCRVALTPNGEHCSACTTKENRP